MAKDKNATGNSKEQPFDIKDIIHLAVRNWKWVLLSLIFCMGLAVLYVMRSVPVYKCESSVIVKDEADGLSLGGMPDLGLGDLGLFSGNSNFENEIVTFRSPDYMKEVVEKLDLETTYRMRKGLRKIPLYGNTLPLTVSFIDLNNTEGASIKFTVFENGDIKVSRKMTINGEPVKMDADVMTRFDKPFNTPAGMVVIRKTSNWGKAADTRHTAVKDDDEDKDKTFYVSKMKLKEAIETYSGATDINKENDKGATVINLTVKDACRQRGVDILNALIDVYNERWSKEKNVLAVNTTKFIDERLKTLAVELGDVDEAITDYKKKNLIVDMIASSKVNLEKGAEVDKQRIEASNNLEIAKFLKSFLQQEGNRYETLPVNLGLGSPTLENEISNYNQMMLQRNTLASNSSENNPLVVKIDNNLRQLRTSILTALDNQVATLQKTLGTMLREENANNTQLSRSPEQEEFLRTYGREQTVKEQLYLFLLQKREENEISRAFAGQNIKIIREPDAADRPYKPKPKMIYALAFIIGIAAPVSLLYLREVNNTKLRNRKDVENLTIPMLGEIPHLRKKMSKESKVTGDNIVVAEGTRDIVNEAFRVVRTNLGQLTQQKGNVVMISSFFQNSGKTFVTMNLGVTLALKGKKTLIIDCDLRRRSASSYVGSPRRGLTDFLNGAVDDIHKVMVCDTLHSDLCVIPVGSLPPNPTELLETPKFKETIDNLRQHFDFILLDCPPSEAMADAKIIDAVSDRTVFILRAGVFDLSLVPLLQQYYNEKKYKNITIILNGLKDVESQGYGYSEITDSPKSWRNLFGLIR